MGYPLPLLIIAIPEEDIQTYRAIPEEDIQTYRLMLNQAFEFLKVDVQISGQEFVIVALVELRYPFLSEIILQLAKVFKGIRYLMHVKEITYLFCFDPIELKSLILKEF